MKLARTLPLLLILLPSISFAWWSDDWKQRTVITLNTSSAGVAIQASQASFAVPVRLHSGNFDFVGAKSDGSDMRVIAADDKTPLKFWIERFDGVNELAVVWVMVPNVLPGTDKNTLYVYAGNDKAPASAASEPADVADPATLAVFHFAEKDGIAVDQTGAVKAFAAAALEVNGLIGQSAKFAGAPIVWPASDRIKTAAGSALSVSMWVRPDAATGTLFAQGGLSMTLAAGRLTAKFGSVSLSGGDVAAATWSHVALTIDAGKAILYVNGAPTAQADLPQSRSAVEGEFRAGDGYTGLMDELAIANVARSADWIKLGYAAQSADAKLIATKTETAGSANTAGGSGYFGILFKSLTPDAWLIIIVLGVMFLIAVAVMIAKSLYVSRTDRANQRFLQQFREAGNVLEIGTGTGGSSEFSDSSLYRLYSAGLRELIKREVGKGDRLLSGRALNAVKASIDADSVREGYALNSQMVLLTIAIAGGPFLGLLGTVVGVMITFASIAAAGDVNVNAIAPGIAAALLATVAGLSVAIPSLFGYNYLASRIKTIASDMQIFVDEFVTRVAESYGA